ncbi:tRNA ligase 1-like isoform X2 [Lotus japonicus]|uniref:tRNA ligase 1-like isoform X2 n=1 Tax=Lotus japonicus TaxID=34305 RepID=UPI0025830910|nr:tRNA ligase 1-like isoform X2 [Lotus japonicus]
MSAPHKFLCTFSHRILLLPLSTSRTFLFLPSSHRFFCTLPPSTMPLNQRSGGHGGQQWKEEPKNEAPLSSTMGDSATGSETVSNKLAGMHIGENSEQTGLGHANKGAIWKPKSYGTTAATEVDNKPAGKVAVDGARVDATGVASPQKSSISSAGLSKLFQGNLLEKFEVDNSTYSQAHIRATFYPKFENEKSDQETRTRMIEMVSKGLATLEVSLKHSGSLFMYAGHEGGAYAKNSFGNIYTAVGVFVLGRMFREAWGTEASKKQAEFNNFLERNHMCISMELVTAVLGDHGQRPQEDFVVVTAVTELGNGKPKFYSTPEIIAFCRKWRLPTNHVWLFSTRKSASSFFAAYDALCEEGTATSVCKVLDEIADVSVPGSKDHVKAQGEILEGLVARLVSHESSNHIEKVLKEFPPPPADGVALDFGPSLREICAANRSDEKQQIKALLESVGSSFCPDYSDWYGTDGADIHSRNVDRSVVSKFLQAHPADYSTKKLQEIIRLMREKRFPAAFKCYHNFHKVDAISSDNVFYKMVIHVHSDSAFRRYQKEMRHRPGLWPLYRGFFVDINLFKANKEKAAEISMKSSINESDSTSSEKDDFADEDANLMVKLKFLTYKLRTFLIRNGLPVLFKEGQSAYKAYYLRQMKIWGTSPGKQKELSKMLDEWAVHIRRKCGNKQLSSSIYLSEAEPFLEQFAKRSPQNQALIGSAGSLVRTEDFLAIVEEGQDEEGDLVAERDMAPSGPSISVKDTVPKNEGLIVFFPGIPGCAKSALCKELLNAQGGLGDDRPVHSLMGDLIKGKYWQKVAEERRKKPNSIMLADKNAPNKEVWRQIEDMCLRTKASAVPVVPESEGTDSNPFSLDALAVFMFRVLQRVNHPGNLDKASPNAGYVLLMFYDLYDGESRKEFEGELIERFGSLVKMPLLKSDRNPLPEAVQCILKEGIDLFKLHSKRHGRLESTKGSYAKEWIKWEKQLRDILNQTAEYFNSIQVPFDFAVKQVSEQLRNIAKGEYTAPDTETRKLGAIVFAAISVPVAEIQGVLNNLAEKNPKIDAFLKGNHLENLNRAHLTLAHKRSHGIKAVADYGLWLHIKVPVELTALLLSDKMAALEACPGSVDGDKIVSKNAWPHITLWTGEGVAAKDANMLPQLFAEGKANRIDFNPPISIYGTMEFY